MVRSLYMPLWIGETPRGAQWISEDEAYSKYPRLAALFAREAAQRDT